MASGVPVQNTPDGRVAVGGVTAVVSVKFTRPANTTTYAAGDVLANKDTLPMPFVFPVARVAGGSGIIQSALVIDGAFPTLKIQFDLFLFDGGAAFTIAADNSAYAPPQSDMDRLQVVLQFDGVANARSGDASNNCAIPLTGAPQPFQCAPGDTNLYGVCVVRNAYVPVSSEAFRIRLGVLQD